MWKMILSLSACYDWDCNRYLCIIEIQHYLTPNCLDRVLKIGSHLGCTNLHVTLYYTSSQVVTFLAKIPWNWNQHFYRKNYLIQYIAFTKKLVVNSCVTSCKQWKFKVFWSHYVFKRTRWFFRKNSNRVFDEFFTLSYFHDFHWKKNFVKSAI